MEMTIIHGQGHHGSTYYITSMIKERLAGSDVQVHEYYMPQDAPAFCAGCFQCIQKGEKYCPQAESAENSSINASLGSHRHRFAHILP